VSFVVVERPADRPEFLREVIALVASELERQRAGLLERVAAADDAELAAGTDEDWGLGQIAAHLLLVERGMLGIALRLARGEPAGQTGQPRYQPGTVTREDLAALSERAARALARLRADFPAEPDLQTTAPSPYLGSFNCYAWLLAAAFHYRAHLEALERGVKSAF
jgi:hypothetical protein